jgi:hypothetical protein
MSDKSAQEKIKMQDLAVLLDELRKAKRQTSSKTKGKNTSIS